MGQAREGSHDTARRDIQDLIAKLEDVNKKLAQPKRAMSMTTAQTTDAGPAETASI